jgi:DNA polymerase-3 subunit gamma/tau
VGQQHVSQTLKNAIQNKHLAQAFLFCGPRGVGKTTCARILAKVLNCTAPTEDFEPCNTCESCDSFNKNASLNISELDAASNNSVDHIRALTEQVRFAPQSGKYKIYIIDEVHMLSTQAFNAFLKTLEEPPSYAIFILATTEKHKIIPTILSRCQIFDFNRIMADSIVAHLQYICAQENITAAVEALTIIAQKADGALRDALSIFDRIISFSGNEITYQHVIDNLNILDYDYYFKITDAILSEDSSSLLILFDQILRNGFDGDIFMNGLAEHFRNLLVCKDPATLSLLEVSGNIEAQYQQQSSLVPLQLILSALDIANDCDVQFKMARNTRLHVEMALIKMAYIMRASTVQATASPVPEKKTLGSNKTENPGINKAEKDPVIPKSQAVLPSGTTKDASIEEKPKDTATTSNAKTEAKGSSFADKLASTSKKGLMSKVLNSVKEAYEQPEEVAAAFTLENIQQLWKEYWMEMDSQSTQLLFKTAVITVEDADKGILSITASGNRAKDAIQRERNLRQLMMDKFQKKDLILDVQINPEVVEKPKQKKQLPQSDRDKYVYFLQMNPILKDFQKKFELLPAKNER